MNPSWKENNENGDFVRKPVGLIIHRSNRVIDKLLKESSFGFMDK
jgi:hypothetical protein